MPNEFKLKQDQAKRDQLLTECKALAQRGPVGRQRAVAMYSNA